MAISLVQSKFFDSYANGGATYTGLSLTSPMTAGSILVVAGMFDSSSATSVTIANDKGDTITDCGLGIINNAAIPARSFVKAFLTATTGAQTFSLTYNGNIAYGDLY